jgi:hypothetical protein
LTPYVIGGIIFIGLPKSISFWKVYVEFLRLPVLKNRELYFVYCSVGESFGHNFAHSKTGGRKK